MFTNLREMSGHLDNRQLLLAAQDYVGAVEVLGKGACLLVLDDLLPQLPGRAASLLIDARQHEQVRHLAGDQAVALLPGRFLALGTNCRSSKEQRTVSYGLRQVLVVHTTRGGGGGEYPTKTVC